MSQTGNRDLEVGGDPGPGMCHFTLAFNCRFGRASTNFTEVFTVTHGYSDRPQSTSNQSAQNQSFLPLESGHEDSSWLLYSMYSKIAKEEDNDVVERCLRETDGTLIFVSSRVSPQMTRHIN